MEMKKRIEEKRNEIINALKEADHAAYLTPCCEYRVYVDSEGVIGREEWLAGDNGRIQFREGYDRCYIATYCHQHFSVLWDYWFKDSDDFSDSFRLRFGSPLVDEDNIGRINLEQQGSETVKALGISESEYCEWLNENAKDALNEILESAELDGIYDDDLDCVIRTIE